ncbi:MAG: hypothetical protein ABI229_09450 [Gemmatimonadaceae bacterium]
MITALHLRRSASAILIVATSSLSTQVVLSQVVLSQVVLGGAPSGPMHQGSQLDLNGETAQARAIFQKMIDTAAGDLATADQWYRKGYELGVKEPAPQTHPRSLRDYRLVHALGRVAARKGDRPEAERQISSARHLLDSDTTMAAQQERFFPYLVGYVALYSNDLPNAEAQFTKALAMRGNELDPFMICLLVMLYERMGRREDANSFYTKAYDLATGSIRRRRLCGRSSGTSSGRRREPATLLRTGSRKDCDVHV